MSETVYGKEDGWVEGVGREMSLFQKKDNHCLGKKKQADFDSDIFAPSWD